MDEHGNIIVKGKKFFPVGAFGGSLSKKSVDDYIDAGFNCLVCYNTPWLSIDDRDGEKADFKSIRETLDYCAKRNFKVVLSLTCFDPTRPSTISSWHNLQGWENMITAFVKEFRQHPALLAWYICDEPVRASLPHLRKVHELVTSLDPEHSIWGCFNTIGTVPAYATICDFAGFDSYPIHDESNLQGAIAQTRIMGEYKIPWFWIGQIMSWKAFKADANCRYPSETEMLAQNLLALIHGAKGIINFSAAYKIQPGDEVIAGQRHGDWRRSYMATAALSDFVTSDEAVCNALVRVVSGALQYRILGDGQGNYRLLLVAPSAGVTQAEITLPPGMKYLYSERYAVTQHGNKLMFSGRDVSCDIIHLEKSK